MAQAVSCVSPIATVGGSDPELDRLLQPARYFHHPGDVLRDTRMAISEKRAILSSWASDACAVESMPGLRRPPGLSRPVSFDEVMDALRELDLLEAEGASEGADSRSAEAYSMHHH